MAQTNLSPSANPGPETFQTPAAPGAAVTPHAEEVRAACIDSRRSICGKILKILPDGLVVDSGYTNLLRAPLDRSWLAPGTVTASRATNTVEANEPNAICLGPVFLTDLPKSRGAKPKLHDYVMIEGYYTGQYTYVSVGTVRRTVRRFSASLNAAIRWKSDHAE